MSRDLDICFKNYFMHHYCQQNDPVSFPHGVFLFLAVATSVSCLNTLYMLLYRGTESLT